MSDGFSVVPESFPPSAQQLRAAAQQLLQGWTPVREQSAGVRFGRGDDMVGPLIQASLQGAITLVDSSIASSAQALQGYAEGLEAMGRTYADAESGTVALMTVD